MVSIMSDTRSGKTPWHVWVVGVVAVLWNAIGVFDYVMTHVQGAAYMASAGMTPTQIAFYDGYPAWMTAVWALGVWPAFAASVLILLRNRFAVPVFGLSLAMFVVSLIYTYGMNDGAALLGQQAWIMSAVILVSLVLLLIYARAMAARGILR